MAALKTADGKERKTETAMFAPPKVYADPGQRRVPDLSLHLPDPRHPELLVHGARMGNN